MEISPAVFLLIVLGVGVLCLVVGIRLGVRAGRPAVRSEEEQVAAAFGILKRHFEKKSLADLEASGAPLWSPDPTRVAALSHGSRPGAPVTVGRNTRTDGRPN